MRTRRTAPGTLLAIAAALTLIGGALIADRTSISTDRDPSTMAPSLEPAVFEGGSRAAIRDFPFLAVVMLDGHGWCGGSLIRYDAVLTAAHCVADEAAHPARLSVQVGRDRGDWDAGAADPVERVALGDDDEAILFLSRHLAADTVPLLLNAEPGPGTTATIVGWGCPKYNWREGCYDDILGIHILAGQNIKQDLHSATVSIVADDVCAVHPSFEPTTMICALAPHGSVSPGDSGGPLLVSQHGAWVVAGIVHVVDTIDPLTRNWFISTSAIAPWIRLQMRWSAPPARTRAPRATPPSPSSVMPPVPAPIATTTPGPTPRPEPSLPPSQQPSLPPVPTPLPVPTATPDRFAVASYDHMAPGAPYHGYFTAAWQQFTAASNTITSLGVLVGDPSYAGGGAAVHVQLCTAIWSTPQNGGCAGSILADAWAPIVNYGNSVVDVGDVAVTAGAAYYILYYQPQWFNGTSWVTYWWAGGPSAVASDQMQCVVRGYNR